MKKRIKIGALAINMLAFMYMTYVLAKSASYTVLATDDFWHGVRVGVFDAPFWKYFVTSLAFSGERYMNWQGTYFTMFLQAFLSPVNNFGMTQLRIVMVGNALLFIFSLSCFLWTVLKEMSKDGQGIAIFCMTAINFVLFAIMDAEIFFEVFQWYSGAVAYSMPCSVLFFALIFLIWSNKCDELKKKIGFAVLSAFLLVLAVGGSLTITAIGCYATLTIVLCYFLKNKKFSVPNILVFLCGFVGGVINAAAPGNYIRRESESYSVLGALKCAVKNVCSEVEKLTKERLFGLLLITAILLGVYFAGKCCVSLKNYGLLSVFLLGMSIVCAFPVAFGYDGFYLPNRCVFAVDFALIVPLLNLALYAGFLIRNVLCEGRVKKEMYAILGVICLAVLFCCEESPMESLLRTVAGSLRAGVYASYYEDCLACYEYLETCEEEEVVLAVPEFSDPFFTDHFVRFDLEEDEDNYINRSVAAYFGKKSVKPLNNIE